MLTDRNFKYKAGGDCQSIWRRYGWVPPSEYRDDYLFKTNREQGDNHENVTVSVSHNRK